MNIKEKFLELTDYTYILGDEHLLKNRLPKGVIEDEIGSYYIEIGESETMFCAHLDTAAWRKEKVVHDIFVTKKGDTGIGTDGSTLLGADDKAGVVILLNLIENKVPGLYYFFIGEESGLVGSRGILGKNPEKFKKYKRCIAFDRRDYGSVITKQMGKTCCSDEFANELIKELGRNGMKYKQDPFGIYTDSAVFTEIIPECTNLSVGYFNEHSSEEVQNITYLESLAKATVGIKWEELPTVREPLVTDTPQPRRTYSTQSNIYNHDLFEIFYDVDDLIEGAFNMYCFNFDHFKVEKEMIYIDYIDDSKKMSVYIHSNGSITAGKDKFDDFDDFEQSIKLYISYKPEIEQDQWGEDGPPWDIDEDDHEKKEEDFEKKINIQDFIFDLLNMAYDKGREYLTAKEVDNILKIRNKSLESFIMWLYQKENDASKTYGLSWDDDKSRLIIHDLMDN
jgi:hypothetical protein